MKKKNKRLTALVAMLFFIVAAIIFLEKDLHKSKDFEVEETADKFLSDSEEYHEDLATTQSKIKKYVEAPGLEGVSLFLNSQNFSLQDLKGKVVIIDFWTYSCINCIRTQPYLNAWHEKYADQGLSIVGVHTPEFDFERDPANVKKAVEEAGIKYPVVLDNEYEVWKAYENNWWPRKFLIDIDGFIRYDHIGEGKYEETEKVIQKLLKERSERMGTQLETAEIETPESSRSRVGTPEIYFGYKFARGNLGNPEGFKREGVNNYAIPEAIEAHKAYLVGDWLNKEEYSELNGTNGSIVLIYYAKNVNIVASSDEGSELDVHLDRKRLPFNETIREERLYRIIQNQEPGQYLLEIYVDEPGFRIYTFTFG